jgi:hypothetical protein
MKPNILAEVLGGGNWTRPPFALHEHYMRKRMPNANLLQTISERKLRVYIAGPLSSPEVPIYLKNVHNMIIVAETIRRLGFAVYIPCLDYVQGIMFGDYEFKDYYENSLEFMKACDIVYVCDGWKQSKGTKKEIKVAREMGIKVVFAIKDLDGRL